MDVRIGSRVFGSDGELGEVHRVIVDARTNNVTDVVVKHGALFGQERMVPLSCVDRVDDDGNIHMKLDGKGFEEMQQFASDHYSAPDPDYSGPPGFDRGLLLLDSMWLTYAGGGGGGVGKPLGFPGGEQISPSDMQRPSVSPGTPILDVNGEKVGEVHEFAWEADGGAPTRLVMQKGLIFHSETELPVSWVEQLSDEGVILSVPRSQVESLREQSHAHSRR